MIPPAIISAPASLSDVFGFLTFTGKWSSLGLLLVIVIFVTISTLDIYALMSFAVAQRSREMAIRIALGAGWDRVVASIASRALVQLGVGALLGTAAGFVLLSILQIQFGPVPTHSPVVLAFSAGVGGMLVIGSLACIAPTMRALRIMPHEALGEG